MQLLQGYLKKGGGLDLDYQPYGAVINSFLSLGYSVFTEGDPFMMENLG